ncbi:CidA/LrgA family protein [Aureimonas populi]|uniref:CidA/LrgA family protein n=1 Tax=Aureimonas populi TaxID=1701758 RepID=A0ABW5CG68_9HYPH|nr:CidA/LrgA family protein [Aureimonas populi]
MLLRAFTAIFLFQFIGEFIAVLSGLPLPGPVLGMVLLFVFLVLRGSVPAGIAAVGEGLLSHLSLLFVPAGAGVILHAGRIGEAAPAIAAALLVSTLATIAVTGLLMRRLSGKAAR